MRNLLLAGVALAGALALSSHAFAQTGPASVISGNTCPAAAVLNVGNGRFLVETQYGYLCVQGTGSGGAITAQITGPLGRSADAASVSTALSTEDVTILNSAIPTGANLIGKVGIDQTTPGTTNNVTVSTNVGTLPLIQATATNAISSTSATTTRVITASGSNRTLITHYDLVVSGAGTVNWISGTGGTCGTNTAFLTGATGHPLSFAANGGISAGSGLGPIMIAAASQEVCIVTTGAVDTSGVVAFTQIP